MESVIFTFNEYKTDMCYKEHKIEYCIKERPEEKASAFSFSSQGRPQ